MYNKVDQVCCTAVPSGLGNEHVLQRIVEMLFWPVFLLHTKFALALPLTSVQCFSTNLEYCTSL